MSVEREESATKMAVECPVCHESLPEETTLVEHLRGDHPKRELAAFIQRNYEETV